VAPASEQAASVMKRYRDAYGVGRTIVRVGNVFKIIGVVLAALVAVASLLAASRAALFLPAGLLIAVIVGLAVWLAGVFVSCQGQVLLASLDLAVNTSHFLTDDQRASVMSLPRVGSTAPGGAPDVGEQSTSGYVSLAGQPGTAFCLGCRTVAPKTELWYKKVTDSYYHKDCIPT
jgi:hypothetical protein